MLIPLKTIIEKHKPSIRGIVHIGANSGQELEDYLDHGISHIIFIEPVNKAFAALTTHVDRTLQMRKKQVPDKGWDVRCVPECIAETTGKTVILYITDNGAESSSMLPMKEHLTAHPDVKVVDKQVAQTVSYKDMADFYHIEPDGYNFLNIDVQGAELMVLRGMKECINGFDYVYVEVNEKELYEGCAKAQEIHDFLTSAGFDLLEKKMTDFGWGDAFYGRTQAATKQPAEQSGLKKEPTVQKPASLLGKAVAEMDACIAALRNALEREVSGSVADQLSTQARAKFINILMRYVKG